MCLIDKIVDKIHAMKLINAEIVAGNSCTNKNLFLYINKR